MEFVNVWVNVALWIFAVVEAQDAKAEPVLEIDKFILEGEVADFTCSWDYQGEGEVNLNIKKGMETLDSCVQEKKPYPKVTCSPEIDKNFHGTELTCEATLVIKSKSKMVYVSSEPFFTNCPENVTWAEGETKSFECKTGGYPAPNVTCSKKEENKSYKEGETFTVSKGMAGKYTCRASSFDTVTTTVYVHVQFKPTIIRVNGPLLPVVLPGTNFTLTCEADGDPAPIYSWETPTTDVEISSDGRTVSVWDMKPAYVGTYTCKAQNKHGNHITSLKLTMPGFNKGHKAEQRWSSIILMGTVTVMISLFY